MKSRLAILVRANLEFHYLNKKAESELGLSLAQYFILLTLRDMPGSSAQGLADSIGIHPSTLTQSLKRLERKSALLVTTDPRDARKKLLNLTRNGNEHLKRAEAGIEELLNKKKPRQVS